MSRDDCFYYFNSSCAKGDDCKFRHCAAALGCETTCSFWKSGNCVRGDCKYRHSDVPVDRRRTPCFFESQPTGCQKAHCPFLHGSKHKPADSQEHDPQPAAIPSANGDVALESSAQASAESTDQPTTDTSIPVESISFHVNNDDESDQEEDKKQRTSNEIVVKSLEQIRMERLFASGIGSTADSHKRQSPAEEKDNMSGKRVRLIRPVASDEIREDKVRAASLTDDLTDLLDGDCDHAVVSDKDDDILQEIDKIMNS